MINAAKCPSCGGKLQVPEDKLTFTCSYCNGEFFTENKAHSDLAMPADQDTVTKKEDLGAARLKITFSGVWMVADVEVRVFLDNQLAGTGSVKKGIDLLTETKVGNHVLELKMFIREQKYHFEIPSDGLYLIKIEYSRTWGNFSDQINLTRIE